MNKLILVLAVASTIGAFAAPQRRGQEEGRPPARSAKAQQPKGKPAAGRPAAGKPAAGRPTAAKPGKPGKQVVASHHKFGARGAGVARPMSRRDGIHAHRPSGARYWERPGLPPPMAGATGAWTWIASPWNYTVDGVYYYGEGYYFDGYNYCYNGGYHLTPPPVVVTQSVVTQPVTVTQPVVTPVTTTPPPPPRRRGLLGVLFGD